MRGEASGGARRRWRLYVALGVVAFALLWVWVGAKVNSAGQAGFDGKEALESAQKAIAAGDVDKADAALDQAEEAFERAQSEVHSLGPFRSVARQVPLVGAGLFIRPR